MSKKTDIDQLRRKLARIVLDDYDRNTRPKLRNTYTLPGEAPRMGVPVRVKAKPTKPRH